MFCLTSETDPRWAGRAARDIDRVLVDHAHCEMKAASSAMSLATRSVWAPALVRPLVTLAREELAHFDRLLDELERRGLALGAPPVDDYAAVLIARATASRSGRDKLVDRLLAGALIEARSCERFKLLAEALQANGDDDLAALYRELMSSEARHYTTLRSLAIDTAGDEAGTLARLGELARIEGAINDELGTHSAIHG
jgi:tRNA-(ms[2]io[6]A)-hydroxylase